MPAKAGGRSRYTLLGAVVGMALSALAATPASANVLLVGTYNGIAGKYSSIQSAVDHAKSGDWILVGPGDYHEQADHRSVRGPQPADTPAGVVIAKSGIHLRGMNRNSVIVDGTLRGRGGPCSSSPARQDLGPKNPNGGAFGRNGILIYDANGVSIENLTVCNFLAGTGYAGNQIWWNGGYGLASSFGLIGVHGFSGAYLTATSTFFGTAATAAR